MLILTRKPGESLYIGDNIKVTIVELKGHQIRVGIDAPTDLRIYREEIYLQILEENRKAAEGSVAPAGLEGLSEAWIGRKGENSGEDAGGVKPKKLNQNLQVIVKRRKGEQSNE
jgi:carbon storage regulator